MRFVRGLLTFGFGVITAALVAAALLLFLGATGRSPIALRFLAANLAKRMAGQRIEQIVVAVDVDPAARRLQGSAQLEIRAVDGECSRVYFLLSSGLRVDRVAARRGGGEAVALAPLQIGMLTTVELAAALAANESVRLEVSYAGDPLAGALALGGGVIETDEILLQPEDLWYPLDPGSFATVDVAVTLPKRLTLVHNGSEESRTDLGTSQRVRWTSARPVPGFSLIAGQLREHRIEREGIRYRVLLPSDLTLDGDRILATMATVNRDLTSHLGSSAFPQLTAFASWRVPRSSFDGSGVIALRADAFRSGDYGFAALAHEIAHSWWGATVGARWLEADTGSQWLVEGFAGWSSWWAAGKSFGDAAMFQQRRQSAFDPAVGEALNVPTVLDNRLDAPARETIYKKGAFVAFMLEQRLGEEAFGEAARQFLERYRYRSAAARDLQQVFSEVSGQDLDSFFADWVYSDARLDLSLDPRQGEAVAVNHQSAAPPSGEIALWRAPPGVQPEQQSLPLGGATPVGNVERLLLDPQWMLADMYRSNNVLPRGERPRLVRRSAAGGLFVVEGEPHPWMPARVREIDAAGATLHVWDLDRGLLNEPAWSTDGTRIIAVEAARGGAPNAYALHVSDGVQRGVGHGVDVFATADSVLAVRGREVVVLAGARGRTVVHVERGQIASIAVSPDGGHIAYAAVDGGRMELRVAALDGGDDRLLLAWPSGPLRWNWAATGSRLFAALGGDWDWQLWEIPLDDAPRALIREAAAIRNFALSPDGGRLAVVALAQPSPAPQRFELFVIDRSAPGEVQRYNLSGNDCYDAAWLDDENLLVIVADVGYPAVPEARELRKLRLSDSSLLEFP